MVKDYADSYLHKKSRYCKKKCSNPKDLFSTAKFMWKTLGFMLFVTVVISITSTIWYGIQVQTALDQIGKDKITHKGLTDENRLLIAQRDLMLTRKHMEKAARKIGLQPPAENQLRYP